MKLRGVIIGVFTLLAIAAVALLAVDTYYIVTDHQTAAQTAADAKKAEASKPLFVSQVTAGVQRIIDGDAALKNYHIQLQSDMALFQMVKDGTEYRGLVTAQTPRGTSVPVEVTAYADDTNMMYELDGASRMRLIQTASKEQPGICTSSEC
jgi:hypothetical protein